MRQILDFTRGMAKSMEEVANHNRKNGLFGTSLFANNSLADGAQNMADAYRTVEGHILREIELRKKILKKYDNT